MSPVEVSPQRSFAPHALPATGTQRRGDEQMISPTHEPSRHSSVLDFMGECLIGISFFVTQYHHLKEGTHGEQESDPADFDPRRDFLKLTTVVSTGALVAACAPSAPAPAAPAAPAAKAEPTKAAAAGGCTDRSARCRKAPITVRLWVAWGNMNKLFQDEVWYKMPEYAQVVGDNIKIEYKGNTSDQPVTTAVAAGDPPEAAANISYAQLAIKDVFLDTQPLVDTRQVHQAGRLHPGHLGLLQVLDLQGLAGRPVLRELPWIMA